MDQTLSSADQWVDLYADDLFKFAYFRVNNQTKAEDLVQETFLAALKARGNYKGNSSEKTWLIAILKHKVMDYYRVKNREKPLSDMVEHGEENALFNEKGHWKKAPLDWGDPTQILEKKEFWEIINGCIKNLPQKLHSVYVMREIDEESTKEVCKNFDLSATNMSVIIHRARAKLRSCMESKWFNDKEGDQ
jgi:RNA polymerase sigma-70 factor (ECF subfamily)